MIWIEAHSTFVIVVFMFGFCYLLATVILCVALILSRRPVAQSLKAIAPTTLTPLGVILGLLIGFLAAHVWANLDRANQYVGQKALVYDRPFGAGGFTVTPAVLRAIVPN
jgi:hypothetical protein